MAAITVNVTDQTDFSHIRTGAVALPDMPRPGELFKWDANSPIVTIQSVTWVGGTANGSVEMVVM